MQPVEDPRDTIGPGPGRPERTSGRCRREQGNDTDDETLPAAAGRRPAPVFWLLVALSALLPLGLLAAGFSQRPALAGAILLLLLLYDSTYGFITFAVACWSLRHRKLAVLPASRPTITVIIPAWNESAALQDTLRSLLGQSDQPERIIVADDGSDDDSIARLRHCFALPPSPPADHAATPRLLRSPSHPHLGVLLKPHTGKADTLNQAIGRTGTDVVIILDADSRLLQGSIAAVRLAFQRHPQLTAVGGVLIPACAPTPMGRILEFFQRVEYLDTHFARLCWSAMDATLMMSGACGAFRRQHLAEIGGFDAASWTEDYELMYRLHRRRRQQGKACQVLIHPRFLATTDAPSTVGALLRQRRRWAGGFAETILQHRAMVGDARFGMLGLGHLVHSSLTLPQPLGLLVLILLMVLPVGRGFLLDTVEGILAAVLAVYVWNAITAMGRLMVYRRQVGHGAVSIPWLMGYVLSQFLLFRPLVVAAHLWGYTSSLRRRRSW